MTIIMITMMMMTVMIIMMTMVSLLISEPALPRLQRGVKTEALKKPSRFSAPEEDS